MRILFPIRSRQLQSALAACLLAPVAAAALGHGVEYQLSYDPVGNKVETRQIVPTETRPVTLTDLTRIYVMPLVVADGTTPPLHPAAQAAWYTKPDITDYPSGNGLCYQWDTTTGTGGQLAGTGWAWKNSSSLPNLAGTVFTYQFTDRVLKWDGSQFTAAAAGATQLQAFRGDATKVPTVFLTTASGSSLVYAAVGAVTQSTNPHSNAGFRLLSDGTSFDPAAAGIGTDGIYLQGMQITTTATTPGGAAVAASDPLFMVFYKNTSFDDAYAVAAAFATSQGIPLGQIQSVPEPTTTALVAGAAVAGLVRWRRRGTRTGEDR
ncbi:MAG: PEP-CTERM sorting domain-containing protein [Planctomycetaceae bacterium]